jgi:hypothetical protein
MPTVSRFTIRAAALSIVLGMLLWNAAAVLSSAGNPRLGGALAVPSMHLLMVGGLTQMVFGVAWWMFPVRSKGRGRGHPAFAWAAFVLVNLGSLARVSGSLCLAYDAPSAGRALILTAAIALPAAAACFATMILGRLRGPAGEPQRSKA